MVALKDTNGDDKADLRESLIRGWSTRDTHALASNLRYGLDNWVWGSVGYSGFERHRRRGGPELDQALSPPLARREHGRAVMKNMWGSVFNGAFACFWLTGEWVSNSVLCCDPVWVGLLGCVWLTVNGNRDLMAINATQAKLRRGAEVENVQRFSCAVGADNFRPRRRSRKTGRNRLRERSRPATLHRAIVEREGSASREGRWNVVASDDEWFARCTRKSDRWRSVAPLLLRLHHRDNLM